MKNRICILLAVLFLVQLLPLRANAETIDLDAKGSITVKVIDDGTPLKGLKLTCIRVARLEEINGEYEYARVYDSKILTGEIYTEGLAQDLLTFVTDNSSNYSFSRLEERVNEKGYLTFNSCTPGLYLIMQEEDFTLNGEKYGKLKPFLVTIPYDGKYHVDASSKPALDIFPTEPPETTKPPEKLPQTGQLNWPIPWMASSGMLLFAMGWWLFFGRKKESYET